MELFCVCWYLPLSALWFARLQDPFWMWISKLLLTAQNCWGSEELQRLCFSLSKPELFNPQFLQQPPSLYLFSTFQSTWGITALTVWLHYFCFPPFFMSLGVEIIRRQREKVFSLSHPAPCIVTAIGKHNSRGSDTHPWNRLSCSKKVCTSCSLQSYGGYLSWSSMLTVHENWRDFVTKFLSNAFELRTSLLYRYSRFPGKLSSLVMLAPLPTPQCQVWCPFKKAEFLL